MMQELVGDDLPGGDAGAHWESWQRILILPEHLTVYPAHECRNRLSSSLKAQKKSNPLLKLTTKQAYVDYLDSHPLGPADWMKEVLKANYASVRNSKTARIPINVPACEVKGTLDQGVNDQQVAAMPGDEGRQRLKSPNVPVRLDVRTPEEYTGDLGHNLQAAHISGTELSHRLSELEAAKDKEIIPVCNSGGRAHMAPQILM